MTPSRKFFESEKQAKNGLIEAKTLVSCARSHARPLFCALTRESAFQPLRLSISPRNSRATMRLKAGNSRCYPTLIARRRRVSISENFISLEPLLDTA